MNDSSGPDDFGTHGPERVLELMGILEWEVAGVRVALAGKCWRRSVMIWEALVAS
jgi:hypothetical protein